MIGTRRLVLATLGFAAALVPVLWAAQAQATKTPSKIVGITLTPAGDMKWVPMPGLEGATQSPLWGDSTKEAHGILYKWPAATKVPLHTHTFGDRGVVVSGTLILTVEGGQPKKLPPGSYFSMASGTKHTTETEAGAPCIFFIERDGPFDAVMVEKTDKKQ